MTVEIYSKRPRNNASPMNEAEIGTPQSAERRLAALRGGRQALNMWHAKAVDADNSLDTLGIPDAVSPSSEQEVRASLEKMEEESRNALRHGRKLEDVNYWRQRAGWADDDATMANFNQGVYDTYYALGDDDSKSNAGSSSSSSGKSEASAKAAGNNSGMILTLAKVVGG
eukprot:7140051-Ditylum_brightwellii.AAC.1